MTSRKVTVAHGHNPGQEAIYETIGLPTTFTNNEMNSLIRSAGYKELGPEPPQELLPQLVKGHRRRLIRKLPDQTIIALALLELLCIASSTPPILDLYAKDNKGLREVIGCYKWTIYLKNKFYAKDNKALWEVIECYERTMLKKDQEILDLSVELDSWKMDCELDSWKTT
ncbi:unnamed protein product [Fusarium equiseti]|uniref:Uncharacterized protein n=1 Tax=Fusarium equiseti TaxID=61235 RepID=A0A8J2IX61_FUSEQ|nr:unnamed protein product [Fusarium equiseti]